MTKRFQIISIIVISALLFVGATVVMAQTFTEPDQGETLAVPLSTSSAPQAINTALGLGIDTDAEIPANMTLYVQGSTTTKPQGGTGKPADVFIDKTPLNTADGTTFSIQGSSVKLVGSGTTCSQSAKVCVMEEANRPAVDVLQQTGVGLFGETSVAGKAGVYGQGYYGIEALASGGQSSIGLKAQSCTVSGGSSSFCLEYGTAGFFDGDFVISDQGSANTPTGSLNGNGENLYRVESLYNMQEGVTPTSKGIAFKSYGVIGGNITINPGTTEDLNTMMGGSELSAEETFVSIDVVEAPLGSSDFSPASHITVQYDSAAKNVIFTNTSTDTVYQVRAIMSYLKAAL